MIQAFNSLNSLSTYLTNPDLHQSLLSQWRTTPLTNTAILCLRNENSILQWCSWTYGFKTKGQGMTLSITNKWISGRSLFLLQLLVAHFNLSPHNLLSPRISQSVNSCPQIQRSSTQLFYIHNAHGRAVLLVQKVNWLKPRKQFYGEVLFETLACFVEHQRHLNV